MIISTKNEIGEYQYWEFGMQNIPFVHLDDRMCSKSELDKVFKSVLTGADGYETFEFVPLIEYESEEPYYNIRGCEKDTAPFVIRGRALPKIKYIIRYYKAHKLGDTGYFSKYYQNDNWNFTDKQKEYLRNVYGAQLLKCLTDEFMQIFRKEILGHIVKSLDSQIRDIKSKISDFEEVISKYNFIEQ